MSDSKVCRVCGWNKTLDHYRPTRSNGAKPGTLSNRCRECDDEMDRARRDKREPNINYAPPIDEHGNQLAVNANGRPNHNTALARGTKLNAEVAKQMLDKAVETPFLQDIADAGGVRLATLKKWLERDYEPFASFAILLREKRNSNHRDRWLARLESAAEDGDVRAIVEGLKAIDPENFREPKKQDITIRRGEDELNLENLSDEELRTLQQLRDKALGDGT